MKTPEFASEAYPYRAVIHATGGEVYGKLLHMPSMREVLPQHLPKPVGQGVALRLNNLVKAGSSASLEASLRVPAALVIDEAKACLMRQTITHDEYTGLLKAVA